MGLLDDQGQYQYYNNSSEHGNYQFISLIDIIANFTLTYVGEDKIIPKARRSDISFCAHRALAELSFDTFKSTKTQEIEVPASLTMILPQDYVNYTGLFWIDATGIEHRIYPTRNTSNPTAIAQDAAGVYSTIGNEMLVNGDFATATNPGGFWMSSGITYDGSNNQIDFSAVTKWRKLNWSNITSKIGERYTLVYTISNYSGSGVITPRLNSPDGYILNFTSRSENGTFTETIEMTENIHSNYGGRFWFMVTTPTFTGSISNVSLKANTIPLQTESNTWENYQTLTPNENANEDYNIDGDNYDLSLD